MVSFIQFFSLPDDLCIHIISDWISTVTSVSVLDVAICRKSLRLNYLAWLKQAQCECAGFNCQPVSPRVFEDFMSWLLSRQLYLADLTIDNFMTRENAEYLASRGLLSRVTTLAVRSLMSPSLHPLVSHLRSLTSWSARWDNDECCLSALQELPCPLQLTSLGHYGLSVANASLLSGHCPYLTLVYLNANTRQLHELARSCSAWHVLSKLILLVEIDQEITTTPFQSQILSIRDLHICMYTPRDSPVLVSDYALQVIHGYIFQLVSACPHITRLTIGEGKMVSGPFYYQLCREVLPKLERFDYSCSDDWSSFFMKLNANDGERLSTQNPVHLTQDSFDFAKHLHSTMTATTKLMLLRIPQWSKQWWSFSGGMSRVTHLHIAQTNVDAEPCALVDIFSLPLLMKLNFYCCADFINNKASNLDECIEQRVQCRRLRDVTIGLRSTERGTCGPLLMKLTQICPAVEMLAIINNTFVTVSGDELSRALRQFPALRSIQLPFSVLHEMTAEHWQQIYQHSQCRRWTVYGTPLPVVEIWTPIHRMLEHVPGMKLRFCDKRLT